MCKSWEVTKSMAYLGNSKKLVVAGSRLVMGFLRLVEKEWNRGELQERTEGREAGARSAPLSCPVREFSQSS